VPLALVVPGNGALARDGSYRISRSCRRLVCEAERLTARLAPQVVVFSGWSPTAALSEAEQMHAAWRGPAVELVVEPTATITAENAARTLPLLLERAVDRALVICTPVHLYRARYFFGRLYGEWGIATRFHVAPVAPTPATLAWELGALPLRRRQLAAAEAELAGRLG
jgi:uncharacterized SAM-binding protein YcdF (DUF218 family)